MSTVDASRYTISPPFHAAASISRRSTTLLGTARTKVDRVKEKFLMRESLEDNLNPKSHISVSTNQKKSNKQTSYSAKSDSKHPQLGQDAPRALEVGGRTHKKPWRHLQSPYFKAIAH